MRAGMREFLWKPFPPEQLSEILVRVAGEASVAGRRLGRLVPVIGIGSAACNPIHLRPATGSRRPR